MSPTGQQQSGVSPTGQQQSGVSPTSQQQSGVSPTGQQQSGVSPTGQQQSGVFLTGQQQSGVDLAYNSKEACTGIFAGEFYKALACLENKMVYDVEREDDEDAAQIDWEFIHSLSRDRD